MLVYSRSTDSREKGVGQADVNIIAIEREGERVEENGVVCGLSYVVYLREGVRRRILIDCSLRAQITPGYTVNRLRDCLLDG